MIRKIAKSFSSAIRLFRGMTERYFIRIPAGLLMVKRLCTDDTDAYLAICDHIGDFLITLGYLDAFKAQHGYRGITLYVTPKMNSLAQRYLSREDKIVCLSRRKLDCLLYLNTSHFTSAWVEKRKNVWLMEPAGRFTDNHFSMMLYFPGITFRHLVQYGFLHLPESAPFRPFPLRGESGDAENGAGRIILCPYAQASWIGNPPTAFFKALVPRLKKQGKTLFTNVAANTEEKPLRGTEALRLTLEALETWLRPDDCVIGLRSGLMDYLAYIPCRLICLYPEGSRHMRFYSLDMLPQTRSNYSEYQLTGRYDEDITYILQKIES